MISFVTALILTESIEALALYFLGIRDKYFYLAVLSINIITNPLLNCILLIMKSLGIQYGLALEFPLEALVVLGEWRLLEYVFPHARRLFILSLIMNGASYLVGKFFF